MKRYLRTGEAQVLNRTIEITALNKDGREFFVALTISSTIQNGGPAFIAFIRNIDEQKRNAVELEQKRTQLEISNQQLEQFAHVASHDMKEPIRKILLFTERLRSDKTSAFSESARNYIMKIEKSASRLADMVEGVLAHSSLEAEKPSLERVELNELVRVIESDLDLIVQEKGAQLTYELPAIEGIRFLLYQLFYNLISNSLKFTRPNVNPKIDISARRISPEEVKHYGLRANLTYYEIVLRDNGIGFRQEHAETIFKTFTRLHSKDEFEGTGLGLSLCKNIVEKHHGVIWASGEENVGASFHILLPESVPGGQ